MLGYFWGINTVESVIKTHGPILVSCNNALRKQKNYPAKFSVQIFPISYGCELGLGGDEQYVKFEFNGYELFNGCPVS